MKRILLIAIALLIPTLTTNMDAPRAVQRYQYRDENTVLDKRNIAILAYGSLVNQRENLQSHARLESDAFRPTELQFPVSFLRKSSSGRITAVISSTGQPKRIYFSTSAFKFLPNARNNLAAREGSTFRGQEQGYDLTNIPYMKKLLPGKSADNNEQNIAGTNNWVVRQGSQLSQATLQQIAQWADRNGFTAIIWASFPANLTNERAAAQELINNPALLQSTQEYVRQLADGPQTPFERAVVSGRAALMQFSGQAAGQAPAQSPIAQAPSPAAASSVAPVPRAILRFVDQDEELALPDFFKTNPEGAAWLRQKSDELSRRLAQPVQLTDAKIFHKLTAAARRRFRAQEGLEYPWPYNREFEEKYNKYVAVAGIAGTANNPRPFVALFKPDGTLSTTFGGTGYIFLQPLPPEPIRTISRVTVAHLKGEDAPYLVRPSFEFITTSGKKFTGNYYLLIQDGTHWNGEGPEIEAARP